MVIPMITCLPFFFLFFSGGGEILYVQPPGHQAVLGRVGLLAMMVGASLPTKTPPRIHTQAPGTTCALLQVPGFGFCLRVVPDSHSRSFSSFLLRMHLAKEAMASQSTSDCSIVSTKFSLVGQCIVFLINASLSSSHASHTKSVCSASSRSAQYQQRSSCSLPILCRNAAKHPCPVRAWVRWNSSSPCFLPIHVEMFGIRALVQAPFSPPFHLRWLSLRSDSSPSPRAPTLWCRIFCRLTFTCIVLPLPTPSGMHRLL
jgi:hypothetical protein